MWQASPVHASLWSNGELYHLCQDVFLSLILWSSWWLPYTRMWKYGHSSNDKHFISCKFTSCSSFACLITFHFDAVSYQNSLKSSRNYYSIWGLKFHVKIRIQPMCSTKHIQQWTGVTDNSTMPIIPQLSAAKPLWGAVCVWRIMTL